MENSQENINSYNCTSAINQEIFNSILESIPDSFFSLDRDFRYVAFNTAHVSKMKALYGVDIRIGERMPDYQTPEDRERAVLNFEKVLDGESFVIKAESGNEWLLQHFFEISHVPVYNSKNEVVGLTVYSRDISESVQKETELRKSESHFSQAFNNSPAPMTIARQSDGVYLEVNNSFLHLLEYNREELIGMTSNGLSIIDLDANNASIDKRGGVNRVRDVELTARSKSGKPLVLLVSVEDTLLAGEPCTLTTMLDITERKMIEENLRQSEDRYRALFQRNYSVMLILNSVNGDIVDANPAACAYYGWSYEELCGKNISEINALTKDKVNEVLTKVNTEKQTHMFLNHRLANGDVRDVEVYSTAINYGHSIMLHSIINDVTEQKQAEIKLRASEEKLSTLFGAMTEMAVIHELVFDEAGHAINYRISDCNNAFTQITGVEKEDAVGKLVTEVYQLEKAPYLELYAQVAITGKSYEHNNYSPSLDKHFRVSVVSPRKNVFATITADITEIIQIQEEISTKNKELENYLYVASHDLRSPLVNIQGFSQRLQKQSGAMKAILDECDFVNEKKTYLDKISNEDIPRTLHFILSNVSKMDTLINSLLQISRTGKLMLVIAKVDMNSLFEKIIAAHNFQITDLSVEIKLNVLQDCYGDENMLNQLFSNIIDNALKYRDEHRKLVLEISSQLHFNKVIYSISDTGRGIDPRHQEKIWDVFYRVNPAATESGEGIGLSVAKTIANKHKGKIWVKSHEGVGSTFFVELQKNEFLE